MKRLIPIILTVVFVLAMLSYSMTYTVRFTEAAVVTTFGKASEESTITEPGMRFKAPYPIQSVTIYDKRMRLLQTRAEAQQTSDNKQIVVEAFLTWRVSDPLTFYQRFSNSGKRSEDHFEAAQATLRSLLSGALSETGKYTLSDLFNAEGVSKLPELEERILMALREPKGGGVGIADYGIDPSSVGIYRVRLAQETTQAVNDRIAANRDRLSKEIEAQGNAEAEAIRAKAREDRDRILAFANRRAKEIEAEGDTAASVFQKRMGQYPELAVFLKNLDLIRASLSDRTTVILSTDSPGLRLLDPQQVGVLTPDEIPDSGLPRSWQRAAEAQTEPGTRRNTGGTP